MADKQRSQGCSDVSGTLGPQSDRRHWRGGGYWREGVRGTTSVSQNRVHHTALQAQSKHPDKGCAPSFYLMKKPTFTEPPSIAGSVRPCQNNQQNEAKQTARQQTRVLIYCLLQTGGWLACSSDA